MRDFQRIEELAGMHTKCKDAGASEEVCDQATKEFLVALGAWPMIEAVSIVLTMTNDVETIRSILSPFYASAFCDGGIFQIEKAEAR